MRDWIITFLICIRLTIDEVIEELEKEKEVANDCKASRTKECKHNVNW